MTFVHEDRFFDPKQLRLQRRRLRRAFRRKDQNHFFAEVVTNVAIFGLGVGSGAYLTSYTIQLFGGPSPVLLPLLLAVALATVLTLKCFEGYYKEQLKRVEDMFEDADKVLARLIKRDQLTLRASERDYFDKVVPLLPRGK